MALLQLTAGEGGDDAIDLGWAEAEPLVGRPKATVELAAHAPSSTVVIATEQSERLGTFLEEGGGRDHLREIDLDLGPEAEPRLAHAAIGIPAGSVQPAHGFYIGTEA